MRLASGLRRGWALQLGLVAVLVVLMAVGIAAPVRATTPNLSGCWVNSANGSPPCFSLAESRDGSVLHVFWAGVPPHQSLQGKFQGTLNTSGEEYDGTFTVTEGTVTVSGNGTFVLQSSFFASFPTIDVTLTPTSVSPGGYGGTSTFTLELFAATPQVLVPNGVTEEVTCPAQQPCTGYVDVGEPSGGAMGVFEPAIAQAVPARFTTLGSKSFSIQPGKHRKITVFLNKQGRKLLKKRGSLKVQLVIHMNRSSGPPTVTKTGVVTITK
jgi:hypothetical protein